MRRAMLAAAVAIAVAAAMLQAEAAATAATATATAPAAATMLQRFPAAEAKQGVAVSADSVYVVSNHVITRHDKRSGAELGRWEGDPARYPHLNSCALIDAELVCASSNFPAVPQRSSVEFFDPQSLRHLRTVALAQAAGSLTWVDRRDGAWWAVFAQYDGRGGQPPFDHRSTSLVRFDDAWRQTESWGFPDAVLARIAPMSLSGGGWGPDGRLYVTGHDLPELYRLALPTEGGAVLDLLEVIPIAAEGQAIDWDEARPGVLYGIRRQAREVVVMQVPLDAATAGQAPSP